MQDIISHHLFHLTHSDRLYQVFHLYHLYPEILVYHLCHRLPLVLALHLTLALQEHHLDHLGMHRKKN